MASKIGRDKAKLFDQYGLLYTPVKKRDSQTNVIEKG